jgi:maltooligosyltrehalose trehalohydrolase
MMSVWAPLAHTLQLDVEGERFWMERDERGWWSAANIAAGRDYGFVVNDEGPFPDPRSPSQPHGVHARSRTVDHSAFRWTDAGWQAPSLSSAVIYELHAGTFSKMATFDGVIPSLNHLVALGVTHVELMPVCEFAGDRGWGYDGVDLFAPHHAYGGPDGLKRLVDACHARGLAVLLDVVYNHLGPVGNYLARFGPYFTSRYKTPWGDAMNFDGAGSDEVRRFVCDNALMWLRDYHIDGLRFDAVHAIVDTSAVHICEQLGAAVAQLEVASGRRLVVIAESDLNDPRLVRPVEQGGYGLDAQWSDDFHHAVHVALTGERTGYYQDFCGIRDVASAIQHGFVVAGRYSRFRDRVHGRPPRGVQNSQFVVCTQNHDQVGNRARGERLAALVSTGRLKIAAALVALAPFVPLLFQGEEWAASTPFLYFTDHDEEIGAKVREGRRDEFSAFGWSPADVPDPQSPDTFAASQLNWTEIAQPAHAEMFEWYCALLRLRRDRPDLRNPDDAPAHVAYGEQDGWLIARRGAVSLVCNFANRGQTVVVHNARGILLTSRDEVSLRGDVLQLPPESAVVVISHEG